MQDITPPTPSQPPTAPQPPAEQQTPVTPPGQLDQLPTPESFGIPDNTPAPVVMFVSEPGSKSRHKLIWIVLIVLLAAALAAGGYWFGIRKSDKPAATTKASTAQTQTTVTTKPTTTPKVEGLQLDTAKKYGDKYANGLLPVGDGHYATDAPKTGYVYACGQYAGSLTSDKGGASTRGPWFTNNNTQYDVTRKVHVLGSVTWQGSFSNAVSGGTRTIATNDLPNHHTGIFPIGASDPAYAYDRNPNSIKGQTLEFGLTADPVYSSTPYCMSGESGVMLTGVALFNAFDAGGRDAGAWEVQDDCGGHPQISGEYHYHTLSSCITDITVKTVIGYALDGFPITGPQVGAGNILTTTDLDECHGIVSAINLDGKLTTTYHYVMTQDFPYSVSCFRAKASNPPHGEGSAP